MAGDGVGQVSLYIDITQHERGSYERGIGTRQPGMPLLLPLVKLNPYVNCCARRVEQHLALDREQADQHKLEISQNPALTVRLPGDQASRRNEHRPTAKGGGEDLHAVHIEGHDEMAFRGCICGDTP